jgi:hypothetical protein
MKQPKKTVYILFGMEAVICSDILLSGKPRRVRKSTGLYARAWFWGAVPITKRLPLDQESIGHTLSPDPHIGSLSERVLKANHTSIHCLVLLFSICLYILLQEFCAFQLLCGWIQGDSHRVPLVSGKSPFHRECVSSTHNDETIRFQILDSNDVTV